MSEFAKQAVSIAGKKALAREEARTDDMADLLHDIVECWEDRPEPRVVHPDMDALIARAAVAVDRSPARASWEASPFGGVEAEYDKP